MNSFRKLKALLPSHRQAMERDMREELESLASIAHSEDDRRELGNLTRAAEEARAVWSWIWFEQLSADVRYAWRTMRHSPGFTATALLTLALAIGSNTAIFSVIDAILLRTLPVDHPGSLVVLSSFSREGRVGDFGYADYLAVRDGNRAFSGMLASSSQQRIDAGLGAETEVALRKIVSGNYFSVLGVQPLLGRAFSNEDDNVPVAVVSNRFWKRSFGASPSIVGQQMDLDGLPFTIVGVAPPAFLGETVGEAPDIWVTMSLMPASRRSLPGYTWLNLMGRLNPGVQAQQARADLSILLPQLPSSVARGGFLDRIAVETGDRGSSGLRDSFSDPLRVVMIVVAVVLLIACANLAGLQMARGATRRREIATRLALGAGRGRIVRQLMTESLVLALLGGALGLLFAVWSEQFLLSLVAAVGRPITVELRPDLNVLGFTAVISIVTGVLFGLAPALQAVRHGLKLSVGRQRRWWLKDGLIALQVALSLLLLIVGGLFIRTIQKLKTQDVGFHAPNVLSVQVDTQREYQPNWTNVSAALLQRAEAIPGVLSASVSFTGILSNDGSGVSGFHFEGLPATKEIQRAKANWVGPNYFETSGIPLLEGREFSAADNSTEPKVAIVNRTMARRYFGEESAVGHRFEFNKEQYEIVGVAKDAKYLDLRESGVRFVYFASSQTKSGIHSLELRTTGAPLAVASAVRAAVREADPRLRVGEITTLEKRIDQRLAREFLVADIAGFFSALTLLLVSIGIYGTLAYTVARRTNEIGIRMALGARATAVLSVILRDVLWVLALGLAAGVAAALAVGRLVGSMLFGLKPTDLPTIALAVLVLSAATLAAGYIPARRASRVDPAVALRFE